MRVARLGVVIDPSGAKSGAAEVNAAQQSMSTTATKTANERVTAEKRAAVAQGQSMAEQVKALQAAERAQNRAANEAKRAAQVVNEYAAAQRRAAEAEERRAAAVQRAAEVQTRARGLMEIQALKMNAAFDAGTTSATGAGRAFSALREPLTSVASHALGTSGSFGTLASALSMVTVGSATTVGVLGALALIGAAIQMATEKTREYKNAQEEATKALDDLAKKQRQGPGGDLVDNLETRAKVLRTMAAEIVKLEAALARPSVAISNNNTGATDTRAVSAQRLKDKVEEYNKLAETTEIGTRELKRIEDRAAAESLAALVTGNNATKVERAKAVEQMRTMQAELARLTKLGGNEVDRTRLIDDIKKLNDALNPAKAAAYAEKLEVLAQNAERAARGAREQAESEAAVAKARDVAQVGVNAVAALDARIAKNKTISEQQAKLFLAANEEIERLQFQVSLIGQSAEKVEELTDKENLRLATARGITDEQAKQIVALSAQNRAAQQQRDAERAELDSLRQRYESISLAVGGIAQVLGEVNDNLRQSVSLAVSLADAILRSASASKVAQQVNANSQSTAADKQAANGAASMASTNVWIAAGMAVVSGVQYVFNEWGKLAKRNAELKKLADEFSASLGDFASAIRERGIGQLQSETNRMADEIGALVKKAAESVGYSYAEGIRQSSASIAAYIEQLKAQALEQDKIADPNSNANGKQRLSALNSAQQLRDFAKVLEEVKKQAQAAEAALRAEQAAKLVALNEDLNVRRLRAQGLTAEADALALQIAQAREYAQVEKDLVGAEGAVEYLRALKEVQAAETEAANVARALAEAEKALAQKRQQDQFALDLQARGQTLAGDDRGAFQTRQEIDAATQLAAAQDLVAAGTITAEMFEELRRILGEEMVAALEDFDEAARRSLQQQQDDLAVRALVALGRDAEAAQARREIANRNELQGVTDAALIAQILYVQGLEAEAAAKAEAAALAARVEQENQSITQRMIDAYRVLNPERAAELEAAQVAAERARELANAVDDSTRARLLELYALQDQAEATKKLADAQKDAAEKAERLANLTTSVEDDYLRATGQTFEADRRALERRRDDRLKDAQEAGAGAETVKQILAIFDADFAKLIASTIEAQAAASPSGRRTDTDTEFVTRSGARSISTTEALRLIDVSISQLTVLRNIERNTEAGANGVSIHVTVQGGAYSGTPGDVGRGIAQAIVPYVNEALGRRVGVERRLTGSNAL